MSAIVLGGGVTVPDGRQVIGADFKHIPGCRSTRQTGLRGRVSSFAPTLPPAELALRPHERAPGLHVLCTNPAALARRQRPDLGPDLPERRRSRPDTTIGAGTTLRRLHAAVDASTPWIEADRRLQRRTARRPTAPTSCRSPRAAARRRSKPSPDATWGLHLTDANIALGDLLKLVGSESAAYLARA